MQTSITVITLCRNNPQELATTMAALPGAMEGLNQPWELLVLDGSDGMECGQVAMGLATTHHLPLQYEWRIAQGIYAAMNEALDLANGELVAFMHAGDRYLPRALALLVNHWLALGRPAAVFGQAWIQPKTSPNQSFSVRPWLSPPPAVELQRWLSRMVPCHQAFVFAINFARTHRYGTNSLLSDRKVMREAIQQAGVTCFLPIPVCEYSLEGASSQLPTTRAMVQRIKEPGRTTSERVVEPLKWALRGLGLSSLQPRWMRTHALLWGWLCRRSGSR